jgi:hypothetical protein
LFTQPHQISGQFSEAQLVQASLNGAQVIVPVPVEPFIEPVLIEPVLIEPLVEPPTPLVPVPEPVVTPELPPALVPGPVLFSEPVPSSVSLGSPSKSAARPHAGTTTKSAATTARFMLALHPPLAGHTSAMWLSWDDRDMYRARRAMQLAHELPRNRELASYVPARIACGASDSCWPWLALRAAQAEERHL